MFKLYSKLWSKNQYYFEDSYNLFKKGLYDGIELYAYPGSYGPTIGCWKEMHEKHNIPFIIHAPHFYSGFNFADKDNFETNKSMAEEAVKFSDALEAKYIVFHSGARGDIKETAKQINKLDIRNALIENKPYLAYLDKDWVCNGYSVEEIKYILDNTGAGFCFDVGHALAAANSIGKEPYAYVEEFIKLKPDMYHLSDGDAKAQMDQHLHLGKGNYDLDRVLKMIPEGSIITLETEKLYENNLSDFIDDIQYIQDFYKRNGLDGK